MALREQVKALTEQLDELTDRQYTCSGTQTLINVKECGINTDLPEIAEVVDEQSNASQDSSRRETRCKQLTFLEDDCGPKSEANDQLENRSSQYDSAVQDRQLFDIDAKKSDEERHQEESELTHAEDNKSSESCEIIQKTIESPQDRRSELSNHLFLRNQTEQTQKQQIVANFDL